MMKKTVKRLGAAALALCMMLSMMISAGAVTKYYLEIKISDAKDNRVSYTSASVSKNTDGLVEAVNQVLVAKYRDIESAFTVEGHEPVIMGGFLREGFNMYEAAVAEGGDTAAWTEWVNYKYAKVEGAEALKDYMNSLETKVGALTEDQAYVMTYEPDQTYAANWPNDPANDNVYTFTVTLISKNVVSGGGAPSTPAAPTEYRVGVSAVENTTVKVSDTEAAAGEKVTITVTPDEGYKADAVTVKDGKGNEIAVTDNGDGTYSFTMPEGAITIDVAVKEGTADPAAGFQDLVADAWYMPAVRYCLANDIMAGYNETSFGPEDNLSRAMVVQVLYNYEKNPEAFTTVSFDDVADGQWYTDAVRWAASKGIVAGYGDGTFGSEDNVTIEQVAVILWNYSGTPAADTSDLSALGGSSSWAANALNWAVANGIFKDMPMENANATASRAQTAQMLMNYLTK